MKFQHIISLGEDCFFRSLIDRYNIRNKFPCRMPFDGSIHPYKETCDLICNNFIDYTKNITFENNFFYNHDKNIMWNHEKTDNIDSFLYQISKRIDQFETICKNSESILFCIHYKKYNTEFDFDLLHNIIQAKYPHLRYHIFIFNNYCKEYYKKNHLNTTYVNIYWDSPIKWCNEINDDFVRQMYITQYGKDFSLNVLKELCTILEEDVYKYILNETYNFDDNLS